MDAAAPDAPSGKEAAQLLTAARGAEHAVHDGGSPADEDCSPPAGSQLLCSSGQQATVNAAPCAAEVPPSACSTSAAACLPVEDGGMHGRNDQPPASPADLGAKITALVAALRGSDVGAQAAAARRVAELAAGERDAPANEIACAALLSADAVSALRVPVTAYTGDNAAAREVAYSSLRAAGSLTNCHPPARDALAAHDSGWLPALCALLHAEPADAVLVDLALRVVWYTTRGGAKEYAGKRRGASDSYVAQAAGTCTLLCAAGVPAAVVAFMRRCVAEGMQDGSTPAAATMAKDVVQQQQQQAADEEGSEQRMLCASAWFLKNVCHSSLPPSCAEDRNAARINGNATAVYDAGTVPVLIALLHRRPPPITALWFEQVTTALGWCVEMNADRDAYATTRDAISALVALMDPQLYGATTGDIVNRAKDDDYTRSLYQASMALRSICFRNEVCCNLVADAGGVAAATALFKPEYAASAPLREWIREAAWLLHLVLPQSEMCRHAFLAAGGFTAPAATLAAAMRQVRSGKKNAVSAASELFSSTDAFSAPELRKPLCTSVLCACFAATSWRSIQRSLARDCGTLLRIKPTWRRWCATAAASPLWRRCCATSRATLTTHTAPRAKWRRECS